MARQDPPGHVPILDGVRGVAVLMVLYCHLFAPLPYVGVVQKLAQHLVSYSVLGVDLFFLLSGYLITGILLQSRDEPRYYRNFYIRRVLRIFPLYYATLILLLIVAPAVSGYARQELSHTLPHQSYAWLYAVNVFYFVHPGDNLLYLIHFWSLAVEEHFYLLWPLVVRAVPTNRLGLLCVILAVLSCVARGVAPPLGEDGVSVTMQTPMRIDTLCLGALLAVWRFENRSSDWIARVAKLTVGAALAVVAGSLVLQHFVPSTAYLAMTLRLLGSHPILWGLFAGLLLSPRRSFFHRLFSSRVLRFFGKYSYGIYVIHAIVGLAMFRANVLEKLAPRVGSFFLAVVIAAIGITVITVLLAMASYRFFESPFLALKSRLAPSKGAAVAAAKADLTQSLSASAVTMGPGQ